MAVLEKIVIQDFRNIALQELSFSPNINCITGSNGEGKTNLLDAVYYLSMTKSYSGASDQFNFRHGRKEFSISGRYLMKNGTQSVFSISSCISGEKKLKRDDKPYRKISEHIGEIPIVMVSPADSSLITDSGELRRNFVNSVLSQMDREYLCAAQQYNRILKQRNRLLKEGFPDEGLLDTFDTQLCPLAEKIHAQRKVFIETISPLVEDYYAMISPVKESVSIDYVSDMTDESLGSLLRRNREKDRILRYTTVGIQRDDMVFKLNGHPIRKCGSQGQQKSFLVALKFSQYRMMKNKYGFGPILLLDDLFDKLDMTRVEKLLSMVSGREFGQIFLSDSNKVRLGGIVDALTSDRIYYEASDGCFRLL